VIAGARWPGDLLIIFAVAGDAALARMPIARLIEPSPAQSAVNINRCMAGLTAILSSRSWQRLSGA
jgi:hypothetical protein